MSVSVSAQKVTIPDVYATPGQTITGVLNFELPEDTYSGFQAGYAGGCADDHTVAARNSAHVSAGGIGFRGTQGKS